MSHVYSWVYVSCVFPCPVGLGAKVMELGDQRLTLQTTAHHYTLPGTSEAKGSLGIAGAQACHYSMCSLRTHQAAHPVTASPIPGNPSPLEAHSKVTQAPTPQ